MGELSEEDGAVDGAELEEDGDVTAEQISSEAALCDMLISPTYIPIPPIYVPIPAPVCVSGKDPTCIPGDAGKPVASLNRPLGPTTVT